MIIIHIMCRRYFQSTGTKFHGHIFIGNDWNAAIDQWNKCKFSMQMFITFIIGMYTNSSITHDRFRSNVAIVMKSHLSACLTFDSVTRKKIF